MRMVRTATLVWLALSHTTSASATNATKLDCGIRQLALEYAQQLTKDQDTIQQVHDALRLEDLCHIVTPPAAATSATTIRHHRRTQKEIANLLCPSDTTTCIYVVPKENDDANNDNNSKVVVANGSIQRPYKCLHKALEHARQIQRPTTKIIFRQGIHTLFETVQFSKQDAGLTLAGFPGEEVWISGGISISSSIDWEPWTHNDMIQVANLSSIFAPHDGNGSLPKIPSLFTTTRRYTRARFPNGDPELIQWGYASSDRLKYSLPPTLVTEWHKPPKGDAPTFDFVDFTTNPPPGVPVKNNSAQPGYNWYASGHGGVCADVWGPHADSYWCSNASQGGWAEVDQECATSGQMQIPVGMTLNASTSVGQRLLQQDMTGGFLWAWHSQSWAMHMFEIAPSNSSSSNSSSSSDQILFEPGGGRQGGRNWCRCDQCTYAGGWCGQHETPPNNSDTRLISGTWMVENVLAELDQPGEFYFDRNTYMLYVYPNATLDLVDFRMGLLERLLEFSQDASNITIENVGFRDSAPTYMSEWSSPSGGDWALHRGGAIFMENVHNMTIRHCHFRRLDGNAIFLSRTTRNVTIEQNRFEWIGENAIATWGDTDGYDATAGNYPMYTLIQNNVMRELGIYQKQSSAVGQSKAALTTIRNNIMFNMPRAAINFNDMVGGGDVVEGNLLFNTCRESGDHGPINSWDRQPFLTDLRDGSKSFDPIPRKITDNFIFANYGASEGVDNDDVSKVLIVLLLVTLVSHFVFFFLVK
jgi:hypothetical protein